MYVALKLVLYKSSSYTHTHTYTQLYILLPWDPDSRAQGSGTGFLFLSPHLGLTPFMTLSNHFLTIRYSLVQKGQCLAQG